MKKKVFKNIIILIETIAVSISIVLLIIFGIINIDTTSFYNYLYGVLSNFNEVFLVSIGIYVAVITFLASTKTPFSDKVKTNNLFDKLGKFIIQGIINNLIVIFLIAFCTENCAIILPIFVIAIFALYYFVGFVIISYLIYKYNIEQLVVDSEKEATDSELIITWIDHIDKSITDIKNILH